MEMYLIPWINQDKCVGCGVCIDSCHADAISMENERAAIDQNKCTFCGKCFSACPQEAIRPNSENPLLRGRNPRSPGGGGFLAEALAEVYEDRDNNRIVEYKNRRDDKI